MIPVEPQPEPEDFDRRVRQRGRKRLEEDPGLLERPSDLPTYWRECLSELQSRYASVCAYLGVGIQPGTGFRTLDHFVPKSVAPRLAYEWTNFRLACGQVNANKGIRQDILDPFEVQDGWFRLELSGLEVLPGKEIPGDVLAQVETTIDGLKLNDTEFRKLRGSYFDDYLEGDISRDYLARRAPFVAREVEEQGIEPLGNRRRSVP